MRKAFFAGIRAVFQGKVDGFQIGPNHFSRKKQEIIAFLIDSPLSGGYNMHRNHTLILGGNPMANAEELLEEEVELITLTDEDGKETQFEYLDCIEYCGKEYLVLLPAGDDSAEIVILEIEPVDEENENYLSVGDQDILDAVYGIFKERFKDVFTFEG